MGVIFYVMITNVDILTSISSYIFISASSNRVASVSLIT